MANRIEGGSSGISQATADATYFPLTDYLRAICATQFDKTSNTTFANITDLSLPVAALTRYAMRIELRLAYGAGAGGFKVALGGTATKTSCGVDYVEYDIGATVPAISQLFRGDIFGSSVSGMPDALSGAAHVTITGTFVVNAAGTLTVQFAQSSSNGTASSVLVGSTFELFK